MQIIQVKNKTYERRIQSSKLSHDFDIERFFKDENKELKIAKRNIDDKRTIEWNKRYEIDKYWTSGDC